MGIVFIISGKCDDKYNLIEECNPDQLFSCHPLPNSARMIFSSFVPRSNKMTSNSKIILLDYEHPNISSATNQSKSYKTIPISNIFQHLSSSFFSPTETPKQFPNTFGNGGNLIQNGLKLFIKFIENVVLFFGNSISEVVNSLESSSTNSGMIPIGIVNENLIDYDNDDDEDDDDDVYSNNYFHPYTGGTIYNQQPLPYEHHVELGN